MEVDYDKAPQQCSMEQVRTAGSLFAKLIA
jgi:hypothetical protein